MSLNLKFTYKTFNKITRIIKINDTEINPKNLPEEYQEKYEDNITLNKFLNNELTKLIKESDDVYLDSEDDLNKFIVELEIIKFKKLIDYINENKDKFHFNKSDEIYLKQNKNDSTEISSETHSKNDFKDVSDKINLTLNETNLKQDISKLENINDLKMLLIEMMTSVESLNNKIQIALNYINDMSNTSTSQLCDNPSTSQLNDNLSTDVSIEDNNCETSEVKIKRKIYKTIEDARQGILLPLK